MKKLLILLLLIPAMVWSFPNDEQVTNGNMELDSDWVVVDAGADARSDDQAHSVTYSWKITLDGSGTHAVMQQVVTTLTIGKTYTVTIWVRGLDVASGDYFLALEGNQDVEAVSNGSWVRLRGIIEVTATSRLIQVSVFPTDGANAGKIYYVDDASIKEMWQGTLDGISTPFKVDGITHPGKVDGV